MTEESGLLREQLRLVLEVVREINSDGDLPSSLATICEAARAMGWGHAAIVVRGDGPGAEGASTEGLRDVALSPDVAPREGWTIVPVRSAEAELGRLEVAEPTGDRAGKAEALEHLGRLADLAAVAITNALRQERLRRDSARALDDDLTGLRNERGLDEALRREVERAYRVDVPVSLIVIDIDRLSRINELHGHPAGDAAIRAAAAVLRPGLRQIDLPARVAGGEFCVLLPGARTGSAREVAERLRCSIAAANVPGVGTITATFGVASLPEHAANAVALVQAARAALGVGKRRGRNRVAIALPIRT